MSIFLAKVLVVISMMLLYVCDISAEQLQGTSGSSERWGSGWFDLKAITDFKKGDKLKVVVGGTAKKILLRFLPMGYDPNDPIGIDGGPRQVPSNRVLEVVLESDHKKIVQISVHGGPNPWGQFPLGQDNGPATIVSVERVDNQPKK